MANRDAHTARFVQFLRAWGMAELALDGCIRLLFGRHNAKAIAPAYPATLERKLEVLRVSHREFEQLADLRDLSEAIRAAFMAEKDLRNTIVHGFPLKIEDDGTAHMVRVTKGNYTLRVVRPADWDRLDETTDRLLAWLLTLTTALNPEGSNAFLDLVQELGREGLVQSAAVFPGDKRLCRLLQEVFRSEAGD